MGDRADGEEFSRRQLIGRAGKGVVGAGLAVWTVPEILTATPAAAAGTFPVPPGGGGGSSTGGGSPGGVVAVAGGGTTGSTSNPGASNPSAAPATASASGAGAGPLAFTGFDAESAITVGAMLVSGGWALTRWASRHEGSPEPARGDPPSGQ